MLVFSSSQRRIQGWLGGNEQPVCLGVDSQGLDQPAAKQDLSRLFPVTRHEMTASQVRQFHSPGWGKLWRPRSNDHETFERPLGG